MGVGGGGGGGGSGGLTRGGWGGGMESGWGAGGGAFMQFGLRIEVVLAHSLGHA